MSDFPAMIYLIITSSVIYYSQEILHLFVRKLHELSVKITKKGLHIWQVHLTETYFL